MKTILILGQASSIEVQLVLQKAQQKGFKVYVIDTRFIPDAYNIDYAPNSGELNLYVQQKAVPFSDIIGVFWANVEPPQTTQEADIDIAGAINYENTCLLQLLLTQSNVNWVNSFKAVQFYRIKPKQLALAKQLGAHIPHTYIGNQHAQIADFLLLHPNAIAKPVHANGKAIQLSSQQQDMHSFCEWAKYPITLQNYISGDKVRTYIVGDFMVSALVQDTYHYPKAQNNSCDYSNAKAVRLIPMQLPIAIQQLAVRIMRAFHMQYTAIDWRLTPQGKFVFLNADPSPEFANAQMQLNVDIDSAIVNLLSR